MNQKSSLLNYLPFVSRALMADTRLDPYVPPGAETWGVAWRKRSIRAFPGINQKDRAFLRVAITYEELRRGPDDPAIGGIAAVRASYSFGTIDALLKLDASGVLSVVNVINRTGSFYPAGLYGMTGGNKIHFNQYTDGVTATDFPPHTMAVHPAAFSSNITARTVMRSWNDYLLFSTPGQLDVFRVRIGVDSPASVSMLPALPFAGSIVTFESHNIIYLQNGVGSSRTIVTQSKDSGVTWATWTITTGTFNLRATENVAEDFKPLS